MRNHATIQSFLFVSEGDCYSSSQKGTHGKRHKKAGLWYAVGGGRTTLEEEEEEEEKEDDEKRTPAPLICAIDSRRQSPSSVGPQSGG